MKHPLYDQCFIDELKVRVSLVRRVCLIAILLLAFGVGANAQEPPKAILVDEFDSISCEDLLGRQDYFLSELSKNPQDNGYAIIYDSGRNPKGFVKFLNASLYTRRFDRSRIQVILSKGSDKYTNGRFWRAPPGADLPKFDEIATSLPDLSKPFLFGTEFSENVCPSFSRDLFSKLINENPGSYARTVIIGPSWSLRKSTADDELEMFEHLGLPKNKIKFYFIHRPKLAFTETEYWYIPPRK